MKKIIIALGLLAIIGIESCKSSKSGYGCPNHLSATNYGRSHGYAAP
jgi:hypothetical protein